MLESPLYCSVFVLGLL